jgi:formimidoylglutamate deiminase
VRISLGEELRLLEYSQRLGLKGRAVLAEPGRSTGRVLYEGACRGGAQAAGRVSGAIAVGNWADLMALDCSGPDLEASEGDTILDTYVFAGDDRMVSAVWSAGRPIVTGGRHVARDGITARYRKAMARLRADL